MPDKRDDHNPTDQPQLGVANVGCPTCGLESFPGTQICPNDGTVLISEGEPMPGIAGNYEFIEVIGSGGMSVVYKARHVHVNKPVAIKMLLPHLAGKYTFVKRFGQEAAIISRLDHPNIVRWHDFGVSGLQQLYLIMEYVEGQSLDEIIKREGGLPPERAVNIFRQIGSALAHAHGRGILHRDLKPGNILISRDGEGKDNVKVVDFGIAKMLQDTADGGKVTSTGELVGSPQYMSPEQCLGAKVAAQSDIYALGCLMYATLAGKPPFEGQPLMLIQKHTSEQPLPFSQGAPGKCIPQELEAVVFKALEKSPSDRYATAGEMMEDLCAPGANSKIGRRRGLNWKQWKKGRRMQVAALSVLAATALTSGAWYYCQSWPDQSFARNPGHLDEFRHQRSIDMSKTSLPDAGLDFLKGSDQLQALDVSNTRVTDRGLTALRELPHLTSLALGDAPLVSDAGMEQIAAINGLQALDLSGNRQITDRGVESLSRLKQLGRLYLQKTSITDRCADSIAGLPSLQEINLSSTAIGKKMIEALPASVAILLSRSNGFTDADIAGLPRLHRLRCVCLSHNVALTDKTLETIARMPSVIEVYLEDARVTDRGLQNLLRMPALSTVDLNHTAITDDGIKTIARCPTLTTLYLDHTSISGKALTYLAACKTLRELHVRGDAITGTELTALKGLPDLSSLHIKGCNVSPSELSALRELLPRCDVESD